MSPSWRDECGVFGIWNHPEASRLTYLGLFALQHRGQESCGIVSLDKEKHWAHRALGLVPDVFDEQLLDRLTGSVAIGHVRYSTTGETLVANAQPLSASLVKGPIALAHNGNIVNAEGLRSELQRQGAIFQGTSDTEVIVHLMAREKGELRECLMNALERVEGAFSIVALSKDRIWAVRDPRGFRPLSLGRLSTGGSDTAWVVASETCAFDLINAKWERDIKPGEVLEISAEGLKSFMLKPRGPMAQCIFEYVYFARPDSSVFGQSVYESRKRSGMILAKEHPVAADLVVPVPDSGLPAALGFSQASGIPFEMGIIRNHYVGRTFIEPKQSIRSFGVRVKLNPQSAILKGQRVVVVDDSIVRGTTSQKIIALLRQAGASEVHMRIAAPPTTGPCFYGVDTPRRTELIASRLSINEICEFLKADSLGYLSVEGLKKAATGSGYCAACFDGHYPTALS